MVLGSVCIEAINSCSLLYSKGVSAGHAESKCFTRKFARTTEAGQDWVNQTLSWCKTSYVHWTEGICVSIHPGVRKAKVNPMSKYYVSSQKSLSKICLWRVKHLEKWINAIYSRNMWINHFLIVLLTFFTCTRSPRDSFRSGILFRNLLYNIVPDELSLEFNSSLMSANQRSQRCPATPIQQSSILLKNT